MLDASQAEKGAFCRRHRSCGRRRGNLVFLEEDADQVLEFGIYVQAAVGIIIERPQARDRRFARPEIAQAVLILRAKAVIIVDEGPVICPVVTGFGEPAERLVFACRQLGRKTCCSTRPW